MVTIACDALSVYLGGRQVLNGLSLTLTPGAVTGIIGPNGAGKSTLLRTIARLLPIAEGSVTIDGAALGDVERRTLAQTIAYLPQGGQVHWPVSVERLVSLGRLPHLAPLSRVGDADRAAIEQAMARADVMHFRDRIVTELSGGERARVLLARALAVEAKALLVDEPLAALDPGHQIDVMRLLQAEAAVGATVVVVLHDLTVAARYCDRLALIDAGRLVAEGAPQEVLTPERLARVYGITAWIDGDRIVPRDRTGVDAAVQHA
ncbi:ABC transporter ATP-binding protein [Sphingomonas sp. RS2018]